MPQKIKISLSSEKRAQLKRFKKISGIPFSDISSPGRHESKRSRRVEPSDHKNAEIDFEPPVARIQILQSYPKENIQALEYKTEEARISLDTFTTSISKSLAYANIPYSTKNGRGLFYDNVYLKLFHSTQKNYRQLMGLANPNFWNLLSGPYTYRAEQNVSPSQALSAFFYGPTFPDCASALQACMYRAIECMIGTKEFNQIFDQRITPFLITSTLFDPIKKEAFNYKAEEQRIGNPLYFLFDKFTEISEDEIKPGDIVYIEGHKNYPHKHLAGNGIGWNVICVGKNSEKKNIFLGFDPDVFQTPLTYEEIRAQLIKDYNEDASDFGKKIETELKYAGELDEQASAVLSRHLKDHKVEKDAEIQGIKYILRFDPKKLTAFLHNASVSWDKLPRLESPTAAGSSLQITELSSIPVENRNRTFADFKIHSLEQDKMLDLATKFASRVIACDKFSGLIFSGSPGIGKTHLSIAVANEVAKAGKKVLFVDAAYIGNFYNKEYRQTREIPSDVFMLNTYKKWIRDIDLIIFDDTNCEFGIEKQFVQFILNHAIRFGKHIMISSNQPVKYELDAYIGYGEQNDLCIYQGITDVSNRKPWWTKSQAQENIVKNDDAIELLANYHGNSAAGIVLEETDFDLKKMQARFEKVSTNKTLKVRLVGDPYHEIELKGRRVTRYKDMHIHDFDKFDVFIIKVTDSEEQEQLIHLIFQLHDAGKKIIVLTDDISKFNEKFYQKMNLSYARHQASRLQDRARNLLLKPDDWLVIKDVPESKRSSLSTTAVLMQKQSLIATALVESKQKAVAVKNKANPKMKVIVKTKMFAGISHKLDAALARKMLEQQGIEYKKLSNPILYRGDTRPPKEIFKTGFYRRIEDGEFRCPSVTPLNESRNCVACTKDIGCAIGFADNPTTDAPKGNYSWVYMIYSPEGSDRSESTKMLPTMGEKVKEVSLTHVPPQNIIAAIQIQTTANKIWHYHKCERITPDDYPKSGRTPVINIAMNPNCDLDKALYESALEKFFEYYKIGFYKNPWAKHDKVVLYSPDPIDFVDLFADLRLSNGLKIS